MTNKGWYAIKPKQPTNLNVGQRSDQFHWKYIQELYLSNII